MLPPLPTLERHHLRAESVPVSGSGTLEALVPTAEPYLCTDPRAPILLLIPGMGLDGIGLIRFLPLGALTHLHLMQVPNEAASGERGLAQFARHVEEFILAKNLQDHPGGLILGGNSMGGAISLLIAARGRVKLRGLVLVGTYGSCRHLPALQRFLAPLAYVVPMGLVRAIVWRVAGGARVGSRTPEEGRWMSQPLIKRSQGYFGRAVGALTRIELIEDAKKLDLPALVVHGSHDSVLPLAAGVELAESIPGAKLVKIEGARHSLFFTHAEAVNAAIENFICSNDFSADN